MRKALALSVLLCLLCSGCCMFGQETVEVKVIDVETKRDSDSDMYLVFTDKGTFENSDIFYFGKFNSSDIQGKLAGLRGKKVRLKVGGFRGSISFNVQECDKSERRCIEGQVLQ